MKVLTEEIIKETNGNCDIINITNEVTDIISRSKMNKGTCLVFSIGSTASISTLEFEPGLLKDIPKVLEKLIPQYQKYQHNETWGDNNGHAHIRSSLFGTSFTFPFINGEPMLGTWQQIVLIDFDDRKRTRRVIIQLTGA